MKKGTILLAVLVLLMILSAGRVMAQDPNLQQGVIPEVNADLAQQLEQGDITLEQACATPGYAQVNCQGVDTAEASATASTTASASASASAPAAQYQYAPEDQYSAPAAGELPPTGGFNLPLFIGVVLLVVGIIVASRLYLRRRHQ
jgi:uncharacterized iron-regulated membrane protein